MMSVKACESRSDLLLVAIELNDIAAAEKAISFLDKQADSAICIQLAAELGRISILHTLLQRERERQVEREKRIDNKAASSLQSFVPLTAACRSETSNMLTVVELLQHIRYVEELHKQEEGQGEGQGEGHSSSDESHGPEMKGLDSHAVGRAPAFSQSPSFRLALSTGMCRQYRSRVDGDVRSERQAAMSAQSLSLGMSLEKRCAALGMAVRSNGHGGQSSASASASAALSDTIDNRVFTTIYDMQLTNNEELESLVDQLSSLVDRQALSACLAQGQLQHPSQPWYELEQGYAYALPFAISLLLLLLSSVLTAHRQEDKHTGRQDVKQTNRKTGRQKVRSGG